MRTTALLPLAAILALVSCDGTRTDAPASGTASAASLTLGGKKFDVTLILTEKERRHAIPQLAPPGETRGHLFAWPRERYVKLEGEGTRVPFDAVFLDKSGAVVDLQPLPARSEEGLMPKAPAAYALLIASGQTAKLGLKPGDKATLSPELLAAKPEELPLMKIGNASAWVELCLTEAERQHGLMHRPHMSADDGMLFAYTYEANHSFWMKNTFIPLDIAFFAEDGTLINVNETPMYADPRNPGNGYATSDSKGPARYVLEMNLGWFRAKNLVDASGRIAPGTKAEFPAWAVKGASD